MRPSNGDCVPHHNHTLDRPGENDNRNYDYSSFPDLDRAEYPIIVDMITSGSSVIDLGCGNGALLARLQKEKSCVGTGVEISPSGVEAARNRGLNVTLGRIDERLPFADGQFDFAVCNVTIQMVMYPERLLQEMKRVARFQIVSFPNFGFWRNRLDLLWNGRMPRPMLFGYSWYATGHIHQLSFSDFHSLVKDVDGLTIRERRFPPYGDPFRRGAAALFPDLFHMLGIYLLEKK